MRYDEFFPALSVSNIRFQITVQIRIMYLIVHRTLLTFKININEYKDWQGCFLQFQCDLPTVNVGISYRRSRHLQFTFTFLTLKIGWLFSVNNFQSFLNWFEDVWRFQFKLAFRNLLIWIHFWRHFYIVQTVCNIDEMKFYGSLTSMVI